MQTHNVLYFFFSVAPNFADIHSLSPSSSPSLPLPLSDYMAGLWSLFSREQGKQSLTLQSTFSQHFNNNECSSFPYMFLLFLYLVLCF